jgi:translation initiation factor IF-1
LEDYSLNFTSNTLTFTAFNQKIELPKTQIGMSGVRPKLNIDPMKIKDGDNVLVEWEPTEEFRCTYKYLKK